MGNNEAVWFVQVHVNSGGFVTVTPQATGSDRGEILNSERLNSKHIGDTKVILSKKKSWKMVKTTMIIEYISEGWKKRKKCPCPIPIASFRSPSLHVGSFFIFILRDSIITRRTTSKSFDNVLNDFWIACQKPVYNTTRIGGCNWA